MTYNRPIPRRQPSESAVEKPYKLIPFPTQPPTLKKPAGHDRYRAKHLHGNLKLKLTVRTPVHISTGLIVMGSDVGDRAPLIKTMFQDGKQQLTIPGSSLKGVIRSTYEAITNSTLAVTTSQKKLPKGKQIPRERLPCDNREKLCPASRVFGALNWQGLVSFTDAVCVQTKPVTGFMPSLYRPRPDQRRDYFKNGKAAGRKFYYHAAQARSGGDRGTPVQQAGTDYTFTTQIQFKNLTQAELGTLLIVLGQDPQYPFALKIGGGKPIGMGTLTVKITALEQVENLRDRYTRYATSPCDQLTTEELRALIQPMIAAAHRELVEKQQLEELARIWQWPTEREAPEGMY